MDSLKAIGQIIKSKREEKGLSQDQLAQRLDVTKSTISSYETGQRRPTIDRVKILASVLEVDQSDLLDVDVPNDSLNLALRAEGIVNGDDLEEIKRYIQFRKSIRDNPLNNDLK
jgi:transcriptional regulator with XRE-family HTH domain